MSLVRTDRLLLRTWSMADLDELAEVFANPDVWWFPYRRGLSRDETEAFLERRLTEWHDRSWGTWAVECDGRLIGYAGFALPTFLPEVMPVPEIGWRLHPSYWGRGLATEAARAALTVGFGELGFPEIVSIHEPENVASGKVMLRLGMTLDRETVHPELGMPLIVRRLTAAAWQSSPGEKGSSGSGVVAQ